MSGVITLAWFRVKDRMRLLDLLDEELKAGPKKTEKGEDSVSSSAPHLMLTGAEEPTSRPRPGRFVRFWF
jgi:hypothetical protein